MSAPVAMAIAAHPDDIELMMGGTLALLGDLGFETHYLNIANGSMGTDRETREAIIARRTAEAREAAGVLGAVYHEPFVDDIDIFFNRELPRRVCALIREARPRILLVQSPQDYMEDHTNACRVAVSAAFYRGMRNYVTEPDRPAIADPVTIYHALPWGLLDPLRRRVRAGQYVDISSTMARKRDALACHRSQKEWLDVSQGLDSYLTTMEDMSRAVGEMSRAFPLAEGWRRRLHLGYCGPDDDPLSEALGDRNRIDADYEAGLAS